MDENNNINFVQEIFHDLFSSMEALETQSAAILQFLKDKGIATDEELASHLEQAENASSVRWRGVRVRADYLFASAVKAAEQAAQKESPKPAENKQESKPDTKQSGGRETTKRTQQGATQAADDNKPDNNQPENEQPENDKPEADEAGTEVEQEVERNTGRDIEQDVKQDRNQRDDADNRPRKNDTEQAA